MAAKNKKLVTFFGNDKDVLAQFCSNPIEYFYGAVSKPRRRNNCKGYSPYDRTVTVVIDGYYWSGVKHHGKVVFEIRKQRKFVPKDTSSILRGKFKNLPVTVPFLNKSLTGKV